jgi:hypothetical protein
VTVFYQQNVYISQPLASSGPALLSLLPLALALALVGFGLLASTWLVSVGLLTQLQSLYLSLGFTCTSLGLSVGILLREVQQ